MHDQKLVAALASASLWLLVFVLAATPAFAAPAYEARADTRTASGQRAASGPGDPEELEAFMDHFFAAQMAELNIPGAAIVVVKDGQIFLAKGYGYADLERQTPVDPARTAFRAGSVSKLFTWTAVMQMVE